MEDRSRHHCPVFAGRFSANISGSMTPLQTRVTGPVMVAEKAGVTLIESLPPGM
jgi:hypothetical protein